ncbi:hypothetical protein [Kamptonema formosum]|uniref:hypothetical protein n=1 Tax=Kamptonema formosum TaxID=331992 RepID=UPI0003449701|nr:hypothetical protein [Oscillatoria sp. PCC 10802]
MNNNLINSGVTPDPTSKSRKHSLTAMKAKQPPILAKANLPARTGKQTQSPGAHRSGAQGLMSLAAFVTGTGLLAGGAWLSVQLITNPAPATWVSQLPGKSEVPVNDDIQPTVSLTEIRTELRKSGLLPALLVPLNTKTQELIPSALGPEQLMQVLVAKPPKSLKCQSPCQPIQELRIYQPSPPRHDGSETEQYFRLVTQVPAPGPAESFVLAPVIQSSYDVQGSSRPLPLTALEPVRGEAPKTGVWLNFTGYRPYGKTKIAYGQLYHYNPEHSHLGLLVEWTSPAGTVPIWQEVTGGGEPELVVNQTQGKDLHFEVYQLRRRNFLPNPLELEPISLKEPALPDESYWEALQLAKNGLWSDAWKQMQSLKAERGKNKQGWPKAAQLQMDVIAFHAKMSQKQADASWADPKDRVLMALLDARWEKALEIFEANLDDSYKTALMLKADKGELWKRVEAALKVNPQRTAAKGWGALIVAAQEGKAQALAWLDAQGNNSSAIVGQVDKLLERLDVALSESTLIDHPGRIVGSAVPVAAVKPADWLQSQPNVSLQLAQGKVWYQVRVAAFHDGEDWVRAPFTSLQVPRIEPGRRLWKVLGLNLDSQIEIGVWAANGEERSVAATVKAVQFRNGALQLLAEGDGIAGATPADFSAGKSWPRGVAFTAKKVQWLKPQLTVLAELKKDRPELVAGMLDSLSEELQAAGQLPGNRAVNVERILQQSGDWPVQLIDLTGNKQPEAVLTLSSDAFASGKNPGGSSGNRTLIFDDTGALIYSELTSAAGQSVTGFVDLQDKLPVDLMVRGNAGYSLKRWVGETGRFE